MVLKVRDVYANAHYKGTPTKEQILNMFQGYGCKYVRNLGNGICDGRECEECFDTLMKDLENEDKKAQRISREYDD